jgi:hypothetical protein
MAFHAAEFMAIALDARDRAADARRSNPRVMASDALVSIVMAAAATEAVINELGTYYELTVSPLEPRETASGVALAEVERSRGSTELKYLVASLALSGHTFDRGGPPFQEFSTLMKVRNDLMHPRPLDQFDDGGATVPPSYVRDFERRGMAYRRRSGRLRLMAQPARDGAGCIMGLSGSGGDHRHRDSDDTSRRWHRNVRTIVLRALPARAHQPT